MKERDHIIEQIERNDVVKELSRFAQNENQYKTQLDRRLSRVQKIHNYSYSSPIKNLALHEAEILKKHNDVVTKNLKGNMVRSDSEERMRVKSNSMVHKSHILKQMEKDKFRKDFIDTTIRDYDKQHVHDHVERFAKSRERQAQQRKKAQKDYAQLLANQHHERIEKDIDRSFTKAEMIMNKDKLYNLNL